jgi:hypothetical protein
MSSVNSFIDASSSLARRTPPTRTSTSAIDRARSCYLCEPSLPVRQHASSSRNDTPPRHISAHFFPKPRCARQVEQTRRRMPSSSCTSTEAATRGLLSLCRPTMRLLRSKYRLAARQTLYTRALLTVVKLLDTLTGMAYTHGSFNDNVVAANGYRL